MAWIICSWTVAILPDVVHGSGANAWLLLTVSIVLFNWGGKSLLNGNRRCRRYVIKLLRICRNYRGFITSVKSNSSRFGTLKHRLLLLLDWRRCTLLYISSVSILRIASIARVRATPAARVRFRTQLGLVLIIFLFVFILVMRVKWILRGIIDGVCGIAFIHVIAKLFDNRRQVSLFLGWCRKFAQVATRRGYIFFLQVYFTGLILMLLRLFVKLWLDKRGATILLMFRRAMLFMLLNTSFVVTIAHTSFRVIMILLFFLFLNSIFLVSIHRDDGLAVIVFVPIQAILLIIGF